MVSASLGIRPGSTATSERCWCWGRKEAKNPSKQWFLQAGRYGYAMQGPRRGRGWGGGFSALWTAIDLMMNAIDQRFDQLSFDTYAKMEYLLIKTLNSQDTVKRQKMERKSSKECSAFLPCHRPSRDSNLPAVNLLSFNLYRDYSYSLTLSNVGEQNLELNS